MNVREIAAVVALCDFPPYEFQVREGHGGIHLQATYTEPDIVTGEPELQHTRKWLLSPDMTRSEIVQTVFKLAMTSAEHRTRETFKYRGRRIFGPHFDVDQLHRLCTDNGFDLRPQDGSVLSGSNRTTSGAIGQP